MNTVAAHGQPRDGPSFTARDRPEVPVDVADDVLDDVVLPVVPLAPFVLGPVDVPGVTHVRHDDDQVFVEAGVEGRAVGEAPRRVVLRQAMQQVQHRVALGRCRVIVRQQDVVLHGPVDRRTLELDRLEFALRGGRRADRRHDNEEDRRRRPLREVPSQHALPSCRSPHTPAPHVPMLRRIRRNAGRRGTHWSASARDLANTRGLAVCFPLCVTMEDS